MDYIFHILVMIGIYAILAMSLNVVAGSAGLVSIAHASFFAVGAYVAALMAVTFNTPFLVNVACGVILATLIGTAVGVLVTRVLDDDLAIATFAFQVIAFNILNNWGSLTGGPMGLSGIPKPVIFAWHISTPGQFFVLVSCCSILAGALCYCVVESPFGRVLKSIREDEVLSEALGKDVGALKRSVFAIGAGVAAVAGALYAQYIGFVDPTSFTVLESIFILTMIIIGGIGNLWGAVIGATVLVILPEALRFVGFPNGAAANIRQILYGMALVGCMMWRPQGIMGEFSFGRDGKG